MARQKVGNGAFQNPHAVAMNDANAMAVNPGGVPLYKGGRMVGGIGVAGASAAVSEYAAFIADHPNVPDLVKKQTHDRGTGPSERP